jgi:hypothetical protein
MEKSINKNTDTCDCKHDKKEHTFYKFRYQMHASFNKYIEKKKASHLLAFFFSTYCQNLITRQRMSEDQV